MSKVAANIVKSIKDMHEEILGIIKNSGVEYKEFQKSIDFHREMLSGIYKRNNYRIPLNMSFIEGLSKKHNLSSEYVLCIAYLDVIQYGEEIED